ncbi:MAG TPA: M48 family metalloprotease [Pedococcus sp.]|nr:M48 family metalloprotease [Pedococcus sp.]
MAAGAVLASTLLVLAVALLTPWQPLPAGAPTVRPDLATAFTPAQVARAADYRSAIGPWPYLSLLATIAAAWGLWVLAGRVRWRGPRPLVTLEAVAASTLVMVVVGLPAGIHAERVRRDFGLSTNTWPGWARDQAVGWAISAGLLGLVIVVGLWLVRRFPRRWPWVVAGTAAALTVVGSLAYPLVVEPAFNSFRPLAPGPFQQAVVALGEADGLGRVDVLVSDASIRTTGENAHVSGLGATHRVVLDDTTLRRAQRDPRAVLSVVAHEFGHVVAHDVARGTTIGVLGAVAGVLAGSWLLLRRASGGAVLAPDRVATARAAAFAVAVAVTLPYVAAPVTNLVSRRVEAAADVHSLALTRDSAGFVRMQQGLARANLSLLEPNWWQTALFATHPDPVWRIALARAWERSPGAGVSAR